MRKRKGNQWDVLSVVPRDDPSVLDFGNVISDAMVTIEPGERDKHWPQRGGTVIGSTVAFVSVFAPEADRNMQAVREILTNESHIQHMTKTLEATPKLGGLLNRLGGDLAQIRDRELFSVLSTVSRFTSWTDSEPMQWFMSGNSFDPFRIRQEPTTVYLVLPTWLPEATRAPWLRLNLGIILKCLMQQGPGERRLINIIGDEMSSVGALRCIEDVLDRGRVYGLRMQMYFQNLAQAQICFPEGRHITVLGNCTQLFFGINDPQTAEYVSTRLGDETILVRNGGSSANTARTFHPFFSSQQHCDTVNSGYGTSNNWALAAHKLVNAAEVMALDRDVCITFPAPGTGAPPRPIITKLVAFFNEPQLFQTGVFGGFGAYLGDLGRSAMFCLFGLALAWASIMFALEREKYHPPAQPALQHAPPFPHPKNGGPMKNKAWVETVFQEQSQPKIGAGHAHAWIREGFKELAQYLPAFNHGQHVVEEPGLYGNLTPGEVAKGKEQDMQLDANQEPAREQQRQGRGM